MTDTVRKPITWLFNFFLLIYLVVSETTEYLFDPDAGRRVPMDKFYEYAPTPAIVTSILLLILLISLAALIFRVFWNRFIADVFSLRNILYREALAVLLMLSILFGL